MCKLRHVMSEAGFLHRLDRCRDLVSNSTCLGLPGVLPEQAKRALRFCQGAGADACVGFVMEQRAAAAQRSARAREERALRKEQSTYGRTARGARVDMRLVQQLAGLGYERPLAAEALRQVIWRDHVLISCLPAGRVVRPPGNTQLWGAVCGLEHACADACTWWEHACSR